MMLFLRVVIYLGVAYIVGLVVLDFSTTLRTMVSCTAVVGLLLMVLGGEAWYERVTRW